MGAQLDLRVVHQQSSMNRWKYRSFGLRKENRDAGLAVGTGRVSHHRRSE